MLIPIVIFKEEGTAYGVVVPDVPGCYVSEDTLERAMTSVKSAIEAHVGALITEGMAVPKIGEMEGHRDNPEYADGIWALIDIDEAIFEGKAKRVNVMIPENILNRIDAAAKSEGTSRSRFITRAATGRIASGRSADAISPGNDPLPSKSHTRGSQSKVPHRIGPAQRKAGR